MWPLRLREGKGFQATHDHQERQRDLKQHVVIERRKGLTSDTWSLREGKCSRYLSIKKVKELEIDM